MFDLLDIYKPFWLTFMCIICMSLSAQATGQGCPNEGPDTRTFGKIGCALQRVFSFHSTKPPKWILARHGSAGDVQFGIAFPPYLILQCESKDHLWSLARAGWRFDTNWPGYIFPTAALKLHLDHEPLPNGY